MNSHAISKRLLLSLVLVASQVLLFAAVLWAPHSLQQAYVRYRVTGVGHEEMQEG